MRPGLRESLNVSDERVQAGWTGVEESRNAAWTVSSACSVLCLDSLAFGVADAPKLHHADLESVMVSDVAIRAMRRGSSNGAMQNCC
jgi:hypothetical protein